jgi:putative transposase
MPRKPRFYVPGMPAHIVQRGNNRQACFFDDNDYLTYLDWLRESADKAGCQIHGYVLMTNHVHLLVTPARAQSIGQMLQSLGRRYVQYVNHTYGRTGTLWEGRHKGSVVDADSYLLSCYRYIELNPVRAGMVTSPSDYRWSSYHANGLGADDKAITPHPLYLALADSGEARREAYRELFRAHLDPEVIQHISSATETGTPLGNDRFREQIAAVLNQKVGYAKRGRPRKIQKDVQEPVYETLDLFE